MNCPKCGKFMSKTGCKKCGFKKVSKDLESNNEKYSLLLKELIMKHGEEEKLFDE